MGPNFLIFSYSFTPPAVTSERRRTVQYSTVQYSTVQYITIQYSIYCSGPIKVGCRLFTNLSYSFTNYKIHAIFLLFSEFKVFTSITIIIYLPPPTTHPS